MKYSKETYERITLKAVTHFLKDGGVSKDDVKSISIRPDNTYARFKVGVTYDEFFGEAVIKIRAQVMPYDDESERLFLDVIRTEGDQAMHLFYIDLERNDMIDYLTGEVVCRI